MLEFPAFPFGYTQIPSLWKGKPTKPTLKSDFWANTRRIKTVQCNYAQVSENSRYLNKRRNKILPNRWCSLLSFISLYASFLRGFDLPTLQGRVNVVFYLNLCVPEKVTFFLFILKVKCVQCSLSFRPQLKLNTGCSCDFQSFQRCSTQ